MMTHTITEARVIRRKNAILGVSAIRSQSRVSRDRKKRQDEFGFLNSNKNYRIKRDEVEKFSASGLRTSGIPLKKPEQVRRGRGSKRCKRTATDMEVRVRHSKRSYGEGERRIRRLQARMRWGRYIGRM